MPNPILPIQNSTLGLTAIVNVTNKVGADQVNIPADVRVVQRLTQMSLKGKSTGRLGLPNANGAFDAVTGFWIFQTQFIQKRSHPIQIVDGIVSPARGEAYGGHDRWVIVLMNALAKINSPSEYDSFLASGGMT